MSIPEEKDEGWDDTLSSAPQSKTQSYKQKFFQGVSKSLTNWEGEWERQVGVRKEGHLLSKLTKGKEQLAPEDHGKEQI